MITINPAAPSKSPVCPNSPKLKNNVTFTAFKMVFAPEAKEALKSHIRNMDVPLEEKTQTLKNILDYLDKLNSKMTRIVEKRIKNTGCLQVKNENYIPW